MRPCCDCGKAKRTVALSFSRTQLIMGGFPRSNRLSVSEVRNKIDQTDRTHSRGKVGAIGSRRSRENTHTAGGSTTRDT